MDSRVNILNLRLAPNPVLSNLLALESNAGEGVFLDSNMKREKEITRFWSKVDKSEGKEACWPWMAGISQGNGYGVAFFNGRKIKAHRLSFELSIGPIPDGLTLDHLCRMRSCVNPTHLEAVTLRVNILRSLVSVGAVNARKTHCKYGHPFFGSNLMHMSTRRERICRKCKIKRDARHRFRVRQGFVLHDG